MHAQDQIQKISLSLHHHGTLVDKFDMQQPCISLQQVAQQCCMCASNAPDQTSSSKQGNVTIVINLETAGTTCVNISHEKKMEKQYMES